MFTIQIAPPLSVRKSAVANVIIVKLRARGHAAEV